ncbi:MAG TPA: hypothetical protein VGO61_00245 [Steroidobacteraceae bacterium]|nr:hypothetical protein [Steroidobacteraceae bacterium]
MTRKIALTMGLAILLGYFCGDAAASLMSAVFGWHAITVQALLSWGAFGAAAWAIASKLLEEEGDIPDPFTRVLLIAGGFYLLVRIAPILGWSVSYGAGGKVIRPLVPLAFAAAAVATVRFLPPRWMLFVGVTAIALQFKLGALLALFLHGLPEWMMALLVAIPALLIAQVLCLRGNSPADRVVQTNYLWIFGAVGLLAIIWTRSQELQPRLPFGGFRLHQMTEYLGMAAWLWSFLALASRLEPEDSGQHGDATTAGPGTLVCVLLAFTVVIGICFGLLEPLTSLSPSLALWLCLLIAGAILFFMGVFTRVPVDGPGHGVLIASVVVFVLAFFGGWPVASDLDVHSQGQAMMGLIYLAILVGPLVMLGQTLAGIGIILVMFNLQRRSAA